jgi:hypothetical protein
VQQSAWEEGRAAERFFTCHMRPPPDELKPSLLIAHRSHRQRHGGIIHDDHASESRSSSCPNHSVVFRRMTEFKCPWSSRNNGRSVSVQLRANIFARVSDRDGGGPVPLLDDYHMQRDGPSFMNTACSVPCALRRPPLSVCPSVVGLFVHRLSRHLCNAVMAYQYTNTVAQQIGRRRFGFWPRN